VLETPKYFQESASGVPLAVFGFGFSLFVLSFANAGIVPTGANLFVAVAVAFGTGALGMLVGGLWEYRNGNLFGGTFGVGYACFLFTTALMLRWIGPEITAAAGPKAFGDAFGAYLIIWAVFTAFFALGAWRINMPAFIAFALLVVVYLVIAIYNISAPSGTGLLKLADWVGVVDSCAAWYLGFGRVLNPMFDHEILPLMSFPYGRAGG
jgi:uncharacterized protein